MSSCTRDDCADACVKNTRPIALGSSFGVALATAVQIRIALFGRTRRVELATPRIVGPLWSTVVGR